MGDAASVFRRIKQRICVYARSVRDARKCKMRPLFYKGNRRTRAKLVRRNRLLQSTVWTRPCEMGCESACGSCRGGGTTVVMLIPARTDTAYFHDYIYKKHAVRFIRGRLHFNESKSAAPFPSMVVVMRSTDAYDPCGRNA